VVTLILRNYFINRAKIRYLIIGDDFFNVWFPAPQRAHVKGPPLSLKVYEIFRSIQGESSFVGLPCVFVRLAGCNLRCRYCDTRYAQEGGEEMTLEEILKRVSEFAVKLVEVTGGEPLFQSETPILTMALREEGYQVLVETNGSLDISVLPEGVIRIMDIKCPASGESHRVMWENLWKLRPDDEVKFVISDRHDYEWARGIILERFEQAKTKILFSTVFGELPPRHLVEWMLEDRIQARFQLQIHKYIWPHDARGV
jgi:7-carboxy-7-deazaguanine synthase